MLTAAHCTDGARSIEVVMGAHNIRLEESSQVSVRTTDYFVHEEWNPSTLSNDVSVIRLPSPVTFNGYINKVALPRSDLNVGDTVTPTGWGKNSDLAGGITDKLRQ
ncbi:trypsin-like serine protease, partial [Pseudomonas aeruginosa]